MNIGKNIKKIRKDLGLTVGDVARIVGISRATMYRYESGDISKIPSDIIEKLCGVLHVNHSDILDSEEPENIVLDSFMYSMYDATRCLGKEDRQKLLSLAEDMKKKKTGK